MMRWIPFFLLLTSWTVQPKENVALYRGSFDPPHLGHLKIIEAVLDSGISQLFVLPIRGEKSFPYSVRKEMLKAFESERIHVISSIDPALLNSNLYLIYGADVVSTRYNAIKDNPIDCAGYFIFSRKGYSLGSDLLNSFDGMHILPIEIDLPYSSTTVRKRIREGKDLSELVHPTTQNLIDLSQAYEKISLAKLEGSYPKDLCKPYVFQKSIPHMIQQLTDAKEVIFVKDRHETSVYRTEKYFVKVYPQEQYGDFINEIWAIETLRRKEPKQFSIPSIVAIHSIYGVLDNYYLIVEKIAPGATLADVSGLLPFYRYGVALAELHHLENAPLSPEFIQKITDYTPLPRKLKHQIKQIKKAGYIHYDAHAANVLYDPLLDELTLLDLSHMGLFTDKQLKPTAPPLLDYAYFLYYARKQPEIQHAFALGYESGGGETASFDDLANYTKLVQHLLEGK